VAFHAQGDRAQAAALWEEYGGPAQAAGDHLGRAQTLQTLRALAVDRAGYPAAEVVGAGLDSITGFLFQASS
jgi:hypothetical protein